MRKFLLSIPFLFLVSVTSISQAQSCSGTPDAGITNADADSVCSGVSFSLHVTGATEGVTGLTYQWQSSTDNIAWENTGTADSISLTTSQVVAKYYRRIIYCGTLSDTSIPKLIALNRLSNCYCTPTGTVCSIGPYIQNVSIGTLNNATFCSPDGYTDYSGTIAATPIYTGITTPITVTPAHSGTQYVAVWIDYNHNSLFDTNEYSLVGSADGIAINNLINVPADAIPGLTKMRVRLRFNTNLNSSNSCSLIPYGETEDYAVNIITATACAGTPIGGTTASSLSSACPADSIFLSVSGATANFLGLTYQWQSSKDSSAWEDLAGKTNITSMVYQDSTRFYRRRIICSGIASFSLPVKVSGKGLLECYCKPGNSNCNQGDRITKVSIGPSFSHSSDCSIGGYGDYTDSIPPAIMYPGDSINIAVGVATGGIEQVAVWIDFDHDGAFGTNEYFYIGSGTNVTVSKRIFIPTDAPLGITRIRVRDRFNIKLESADACITYVAGETEDYLVDIIGPNHCAPAGNSDCSAGDAITRVVFGTIDTSTTCSPAGYGDFTSSTLNTTVAANSFVHINVVAGCNTSNPEHVGVWIDFNHDNIFDRSEFTMIRNDCSAVITDSISIPANAMAGQTVIRVKATAANWFSPSDACTAFATGETEDYKVSIQPYSCPVNTWTGLAGTTNWEDAANWSCQQVPGVHSNVVIDSGNVTVSSNVTVYSLTVNPTAVLTVQAPFNLVTTH